MKWLASKPNFVDYMICGRSANSSDLDWVGGDLILIQWDNYSDTNQLDNLLDLRIHHPNRNLLVNGYPDLLSNLICMHEK